MSSILGSLGGSLRCNAGSVVIIVLTCTSVGELLTAAGHPGASTLVIGVALRKPRKYFYNENLIDLQSLTSQTHFTKRERSGELYKSLV